jgi:hypothetical protein
MLISLQHTVEYLSEESAKEFTDLMDEIESKEWMKR